MTKRTLRTWLAATTALVLLAAACGDDGDSDAEASPDEAAGVEIDEAALQTILDEWSVEVDAFGATLSIRAPGHDDIHLASGVDDRDIATSGPDGVPVEHTETPMPTDGTYPISAITRTFVAAIALQLVDEGRVSLDDPVEPWLGGLPNADQITLAMLLANTSGLGEVDIAPILVEDPARSFTPEEALVMQLEVPPVGPPGESYAFSTAGYLAAGLLIERVLDQDLAEVIKERITEPLALDDTFLGDGSTTPTRHGWFSLPNNPDPDRPLDALDVPFEALMTSAWADGGMVSSSQDLLDWGEALFSGKVLGDETTGAMVEMRNFDPAQSSFYGLGVGGYCFDDTGCTPDGAEDFVGHSGNFIYGAHVAFHPETRTTAVVYENGAVTPTWATAGPLLADALQQLGST